MSEGIPPACSYWLRLMKDFKEAGKLTRIMQAAWVGLAREVAEACPDEVFERIIRRAKKMGLPVKKIGAVVWLDPDCGDPHIHICICLLYTSPSPRDRTRSRMPSSA